MKIIFFIKFKKIKKFIIKLHYSIINLHNNNKELEKHVQFHMRKKEEIYLKMIMKNDKKIEKNEEDNNNYYRHSFFR